MRRPAAMRAALEAVELWVDLLSNTATGPLGAQAGRMASGWSEDGQRMVSGW